MQLLKSSSKDIFDMLNKSKELETILTTQFNENNLINVPIIAYSSNDLDEEISFKL